LKVIGGVSAATASSISAAHPAATSGQCHERVPKARTAAVVRAPTIHIHKHEVLGGLINEYKAAA